jgi:hypothetical protein
VDAHDQDLLVVAAVEDADLALAGHRGVDAPQEVVGGSSGVGSLNEVTGVPCGLKAPAMTESCRPCRPRRCPGARSGRRACLGVDALLEVRQAGQVGGERGLGVGLLAAEGRAAVVTAKVDLLPGLMRSSSRNASPDFSAIVVLLCTGARRFDAITG